ncbi:glycosyltransferase family 2 protein [Alicyclobacillus cycloheptanicus]|uniref:Dolichol-phosphate mannosyltransferase n=1 Tax=Alicyclobacillus cycloheptanicus TaxID=1457 RepID=A0ABT9XGF0_9BACL|nr:glycosyltransferase family 2 protein [Alicyclobacillus cycloheptanicus]MDQ0189372.1 dolichol-phosphate mannosyltransferase [Alicyclobacillus cycloheptanicus]WDM02249.1 glycosyltransferase family 2 protein [Alicyclobacillus cycloheptanicus]
MKLSIVVPTYNELDNVTVLADQIYTSLQGKVDFEIIFVDDSTDDTPQRLQALANERSYVRFYHRTGEKGLGTAVVLGFSKAQGDVLTVMDADLQHPPSMLVPMMKEIMNGADMVIPSRFIEGGDDGGLAFHRKVVSAVARYIGKLALTSIRKISDPTSGFFMFRRECIRGVTLSPIGWKILIEVLARGRFERIVEIPYRFHPRNAGESKMSIREQWNYLRHLLKLMIEIPEERRFYLFALVGLSGVVINMVIYDVLVHLGLAVPLSAFISAICAMVSNFILNDSLTWREVHSTSLHKRALKYGVTSVVGISVNILVLDLLYKGAHIHYLVSNLVGIACATVFNYIANNAWTWRSTKKRTVLSKPDRVA